MPTGFFNLLTCCTALNGCDKTAESRHLVIAATYHYLAHLLLIFITCKFHTFTFTGKFLYLHIPPKCYLYCQNPLLAGSINCKFTHPDQLRSLTCTIRFQDGGYKCMACPPSPVTGGGTCPLCPPWFRRPCTSRHTTYSK